LNNTDLEKIRTTEGIIGADPLFPVNAEYVSLGGEKYTTTLNQSIEGLNQPLRVGRLVNANTTDHEVTIPPTLVPLLGLANDQAAVNKTLTIGFKDAAGVIFETSANIVGVQEVALISGNATTINTSLARDTYTRIAASLPAAQRDQYPLVFARFNSNAPQAELDALKGRLQKSGYDATTLKDQLGVITTVIKGITTFLNVFAGIALVAATFGIVNTLLMAVQERTREIGLMKALGMGRSKIFALFSFEAILIGFWGAVAALLVANLLGRLGNHIAMKTIFKDFAGLHLFSFPLLSMLQIIGLIMFIAFVAATLPARRASRLDPIEALRYE
jgi:putative ABC transport system permease protein